MKIILSGGGTLGPVTPLISIMESCKKKYPDTQFLWVGTQEGPESEVVKSYGLPFFVIGAGKWRRYFSWLNFLDIFKIIIGFFQSIILLWHEKPSLLISAGGFVSVPLHWAGAFLGIPSWVHQQDIRPGLANRLMAPVASIITTSLQETTKFFSAHKTRWIGNPARNLKMVSRETACKYFNIPPSAPVVIFALGGGTGSATINRIILESLPSWPRNWHIIHLTGKERPSDIHRSASRTFPNYHVYTFFTKEMGIAYSIADVVIARAGFGTLTELANFSKPAIIFPMTHTHQEQNAYFLASKNAIIQLPEEGNSGSKLSHIVVNLIKDQKKQMALGAQLHKILPKTSEDKIIEIIDQLIGKN